MRQVNLVKCHLDWPMHQPDFDLTQIFLKFLHFQLNPYKFKTVFKNPDDAADVGFSLKSLDLEISNGPVDGFKVDIDNQFKTSYLKFQRTLHSLSSSGCPNISYEAYLDNTAFHSFDLTSSGGDLKP